jgi:ribosomal protein L17
MGKGKAQFRQHVHKNMRKMALEKALINDCHKRSKELLRKIAQLETEMKEMYFKNSELIKREDASKLLHFQEETLKKEIKSLKKKYIELSKDIHNKKY